MTDSHKFTRMCDNCSTVHAHSNRIKRSKRAPAYFVCQQCYDWSFGKSNKKSARVMPGSPIKNLLGVDYATLQNSKHKRKTNCNKMKDDKKANNVETTIGNVVSNVEGLLESAAHDVKDAIIEAAMVVESSLEGFVSGVGSAVKNIL